MTLFLRILATLCALTTAAHFLRFGTPWDAAPPLALIPALFLPRLLPRPLLAAAAAAGVALWASQTFELATWRMSLGMPWMRLALILGAVSLAHLAVFVLLLGDAGKRIFGPVRAVDWVRTAIVLLTGATLAVARSKAPFELLLGHVSSRSPARSGSRSSPSTAAWSAAGSWRGIRPRCAAGSGASSPWSSSVSSCSGWRDGKASS